MRRAMIILGLFLLGAGPCVQRLDPDVNDDGVVDILDVSLVASCLGVDPAVDERCVAADVIVDGAIDQEDLDHVTASFDTDGWPHCGDDVVNQAGETCDGADDSACPGSCRDDCTCLAELAVAITAPEPGFLTALPSVDVAGTVGALAVEVRVDEFEATLSGGTFTAPAIPLQEGTNTLTATATDALGNAVISSISVVRDSEPPVVTINRPAAGSTTERSTVTVAGTVNDVVVGTVSAGNVVVRVNGVEAVVANRSFVLADAPLDTSAEGAVTEIVVEAEDAAGNASAPVTLRVTYSVPTAPRIRAVAGDNQAALIGTFLPSPLVVELVDAAGAPVAGEMVVFRVVSNNGLLDDGARQAASVAVPTDTAGVASARWKLGTRAGAGNHVVEATAVGFAGAATFSAVGRSGAPALIVVDSGNQQTGVVGRPLPRPLVAVVVDEGNNRIAGVPVTFEAVKGDGRFADGSTREVVTDSDGRAVASLVLGPNPGTSNNIVRATFPANPGLPANFIASGRQAGDPARTRVSGIVLDNTDQPIEGVTLSILGSDLETQSDANGQFELMPAPVGTVFLEVDGSTTSRPGVWPTLEYELVTIPGVDNRLPRPIHLLEIAVEDSIFVSDTEGGALRVDELPGFSLTIDPGTVTFPDGGHSGFVSVTVVHADKIPMTPGFGQQPRLIVTIQPSGAEFDPPAPLTLPNVEGLSPGEVTELYSFDHDLGQFVAIGTGTVSEDGSLVRSDPGVGIIKAGWHASGPPAQTGCLHGCGECYRLSTDGGVCECVPLGDGAPCDDGNSCTADTTCFANECGGGRARMNVTAGSPAERQAWLGFLDKCKDSEALQEICGPDGVSESIEVELGTEVVLDDPGGCGTVSVWLDDFCSNAVDLDDLAKLDELRCAPWGTDSCQIILHILAERESAHFGNPYPVAHDYAHSIEGAYREERGRRGSKPANGCVSGDDPIDWLCGYDVNEDGEPDLLEIYDLHEDSGEEIRNIRCLPAPPQGSNP